MATYFYHFVSIRTDGAFDFQSHVDAVHIMLEDAFDHSSDVPYPALK